MYYAKRLSLRAGRDIITRCVSQKVLYSIWKLYKSMELIDIEQDDSFFYVR